VTVRPAPYPADTRARGWRFELDYERIDQSDTWGLAAEIPMAQPALLMMWLVAWTREPCGTLPADENVIRAKCRIPAAMWPKLRVVLMRGWWQADDGLLYHDTLTKRVQEMLEYRRKNAERVAKFKAAKREQHEGNALPTREQQVKNDTGTGTGTISPSLRSGDTARKRAPAAVAAAVLVEAGFTEIQAGDFIAHKHRVKAPLTERAWADHLREASKAGWSAVDAAEKVMAKAWKGFEASYVANERPPASAAQTSFRERERRAAEAQADAWGGPELAAFRRKASETVEVIDVAPKRLG
jgi:hypothetical protein